MGQYRSSLNYADRLALRDRIRHIRIIVGEVTLTAVFAAVGIFLVAVLIRLWVAW